MKEAALRKYHRRTGMIIALFVVLQAGTGILLSIQQFSGMKYFIGNCGTDR